MPEHQRGAIGETPAEQRAAARASQSEADYVRELRAQGVLVRPRYAHGGRDIITGYSVALAGDDGRAVKWYGGGWVARDLRLPWLRMGWADTPPERMQTCGAGHVRARRPGSR
ncbi:hypothetical protein V3M68_03320 [Trueperella pyogenes]|uniref:hypothetical protein n=1 Tax=Trueperella pyogenes TaxID=1661 RepID=UPI00345DD244